MTGVVVLALMALVALGVSVWLSRAIMSPDLDPDPERAGTGSEHHVPAAPQPPPQEAATPVETEGLAATGGSAQVLHVEEVSDTIFLVDTFIIVSTTETDAPTVLGPTTFALQERGRRRIDGMTERCVRQWCDDDTILDVELLRQGPTLRVAVQDGSSRLQFDIATGG